MGGASSSNALKSYVSASMSVLNESVVSCTNKVTVDSGMVISGNKWSWFGWLRQQIIVTVDSKCIANLSANTELSQKVDEQFKQLADSIVKGLSFNTAQATNTQELCTEMSTEVKNKFTAIAENAVAVTQPLTITNNTGTVISGVYQQALIKSIMQQLVSTTADTKAFQDLVLVADQTARATVIGLDPTVLAMIVAAVIIAAILGGSYAAKTIVPAITSIPFWFIMSTVLTGASLYFPITGALKLKVWPYKTLVPDGKNADTDKEKADKLAFNASVMKGTAIASGCLGGVSLALLIALIATRNKAPVAAIPK